LTVCLGQPVVELVSQDGAFTPRLGGVAVAVAVAAARTGAQVILAGAAGEDAWGRWLEAELERRGVTGLARLEGRQTPVVFVADTCERYGAAILPPAVELGPAAGLVVCGESLADEAQRAVAMDLRARAHELDRPVILEAGLQGPGWRSRADAAASANACVPGALLVWADETDATLLTGETDPERAALALVKAGARLVLIDLGPEGAILRGELRRDVYSPPAGFGEVVGRLTLSDFYPSVVAAALG
jgi:sugar/nucleoside kinase (ribokinase family)